MEWNCFVGIPALAGLVGRGLHLAAAIAALAAALAALA